jgi:epoxyqueuosine reductase
MFNGGMNVGSVSASRIKYRAKELGADLCGIASVERFIDAPVGFHPTDILKECKSVIVMAVCIPASILESSSTAIYTFAHMRLFDKIDSITFTLALELDNMGKRAVAVPASEPYEYWDDDRRHGQGILSLKHAAVRAGMGQMGKNTLLINNQFGNMILLGAVLLDEELEPDMLVDYQVCIPSCRICVDICPANALDGHTVEQRECRSVCGKTTPGGDFVYICNLCRKCCPHQQGIGNAERQIIL